MRSQLLPEINEYSLTADSFYVVFMIMPSRPWTIRTLAIQIVTRNLAIAVEAERPGLRWPKKDDIQIRNPASFGLSPLFLKRIGT